jgi:serine/threonine-protein kinase
MTRSQADSEITGLGLRVTFNEAYSNDVREGVVIDQNPRQGASLTRGSSVEVTISRGREPEPQVQVPNVLNQDEAAAISALANAGLRHRISRVEGDFGAVVAQEPRAGQRVATGTTVTISVGTGVDDGGGE